MGKRGKVEKKVEAPIQINFWGEKPAVMKGTARIASGGLKPGQLPGQTLKHAGFFGGGPLPRVQWESAETKMEDEKKKTGPERTQRGQEKEELTEKWDWVVSPLKTLRKPKGWGNIFRW